MSILKQAAALATGAMMSAISATTASAQDPKSYPQSYPEFSADVRDCMANLQLPSNLQPEDESIATMPGGLCKVFFQIQGIEGQTKEPIMMIIYDTPKLLSTNLGQADMMGGSVNFKLCDTGVPSIIRTSFNLRITEGDEKYTRSVFGLSKNGEVSSPDETLDESWHRSVMFKMDGTVPISEQVTMRALNAVVSPVLYDLTREVLRDKTPERLAKQYMARFPEMAKMLPSCQFTS